MTDLMSDPEPAGRAQQLGYLSGLGRVIDEGVVNEERGIIVHPHPGDDGFRVPLATVERLPGQAVDVGQFID
jgi:hypothetical protein